MTKALAQSKFYKEEEKMIILITGASHTGKTLLAQNMLEQKKSGEN